MLASKNDCLQEASETIFRMSADDLVRKRCLDREEYYQDLRSYERKMNLDRLSYERKIELNRRSYEQTLAEKDALHQQILAEKEALISRLLAENEALRQQVK